MTTENKYQFKEGIAFGPSAHIDIPELVRACKDAWSNQTLCRVNDSVVRLGIVQGEFHWHKHDGEDEFFLILQGKLLLDLKDETIELLPHQAYTVPRGVLHRPRAPERTVILMVEGEGVKPAGD